MEQFTVSHSVNVFGCDKLNTFANLTYFLINNSVYCFTTYSLDLCAENKCVKRERQSGAPVVAIVRKTCYFSDAKILPPIIYIYI